ncbi:MAG: phage tail domain-containing protein [Prevotella sp.]
MELKQNDMKVLEGLLQINGTDIYKEYGVFLCERKSGEFSNYEELLKPALTKGQTEVDFPERDGVELPSILNVTLQAKDIKLYFAICAPDNETYFTNFGNFFKFLRTGKNGWLTFDLPEINRTFKLHYEGSEDFEQLTPLKNGGVGSRFHLKFREPKPLY